MVHVSATGPFADLVSHLSDKKGMIPLHGDRKQDFDFEVGRGPKHLEITWTEYCDMCAQKLREVERRFRSLAKIVTAVKDNPEAFFKLGRDKQVKVVHVLEKPLLVLLLIEACNAIALVGGFEKKRKRRP